MKEDILNLLRSNNVDSSEISGWERKNIEAFEKKYLKGKKFPTAVRTFLEIAGNLNNVSDQYSLEDFYDLQSSKGKLNDKLKEWANGREYCIVGYYGQGSFFWFCFLDEGDNPPVYMNQYTDVDPPEGTGRITEVMSFKKITDNFFDFITSMLP